MWNLMPGAESRREPSGEELRSSDPNAGQSRVHVRPCGHLVLLLQSDLVPSRGVSHLFCVAHLSEINHVLVPTDTYI